MKNALSKGSIKLSFTTTFELEVNSEEELQAAIRNMPWLANTKPMGFTSGQNTVKQVISQQPALSLADGEKQNIINALYQCENNKSATARLLGIGRDTLHAKIKLYEIDV